MNAVILSSVLSAGNHALFAGTRVLYGLSVARPHPQAPRIFSWTTKSGIPLPALFATSSISILCFGSSFIGSGELWGWLQNIVGVSNQVCVLLGASRGDLNSSTDRVGVYRTSELAFPHSLGASRTIPR
jgi:amino acid permease